jgi:hypothetical protein
MCGRQRSQTDRRLMDVKMIGYRMSDFRRRKDAPRRILFLQTSAIRSWGHRTIGHRPKILG